MVVSVVAVRGLAFPLFLAGLEIDLARLCGNVLLLALVGYAVTLVLGLEPPRHGDRGLDAVVRVSRNYFNSREDLVRAAQAVAAATGS